MQMMQKVLALLAVVMGRNGRKPDMLLMTEGKKLVIVDVGGLGYNFRPKLGKGCREIPTFTLSSDMCIMTLANTLPTVVIDSQRKGLHTVTIDVRTCPNCGLHNQVILGIPKGTQYEHVSLDGKHGHLQPAARSPFMAFGSPLQQGMSFELEDVLPPQHRYPQRRQFNASPDGVVEIAFVEIVPRSLTHERHADPREHSRRQSTASNGANSRSNGDDTLSSASDLFEDDDSAGDDQGSNADDSDSDAAHIQTTSEAIGASTNGDGHSADQS